MINSFHGKKKNKKKPIKEKNMKQSCSERRMITISLCLIFCLSNSILVIAKDFNKLRYTGDSRSKNEREMKKITNFYIEFNCLLQRLNV
ncbi:unnamed protein product [Arabidopsis halleri]